MGELLGVLEVDRFRREDDFLGDVGRVIAYALQVLRDEDEVDLASRRARVGLDPVHRFPDGAQTRQAGFDLDMQRYPMLVHLVAAIAARQAADATEAEQQMAAATATGTALPIEDALGERIKSVESSLDDELVTRLRDEARRTGTLRPPSAAAAS